MITLAMGHQKIQPKQLLFFLICFLLCTICASYFFQGELIVVFSTLYIIGFLKRVQHFLGQFFIHNIILNIGISRNQNKAEINSK